jgi:hypothetical protein
VTLRSEAHQRRPRQTSTALMLGTAAGDGCIYMQEVARDTEAAYQ